MGWAYAFRNIRRADGTHTTQSLHRFILGDPPGGVDHRNGDPRDCRRSNSRLATPSENARNSRVSSANTSGLRGVQFHKAHGKWQAYIKADGRALHLGYYDNPESAHAARLIAERK